MRLIRILAIFAALFLSSAAFAQTFPPLSGRVVDEAHLLSPEQVQEISAQSEAIEKATSRQFVVATIPDLQGYDIQEFGYKLGRAWKIGQAGANNGIILIVAPKERKVGIETGRGLSPVVTDALTSVIINQVMLPKFKAGDMGGGIVDGANAIAEQLKLPLEAAETRAQQQVQAVKPAQHRGGGGGIPIIVVLIVLFFVLPMIFGGRNRGYRSSGFGSTVGNVVLWSALNSLSNRDSGGSGWSSGGGSDWGGGSSDGGGFSGGGGDFDGGGSSGSW